ncbi:major capsid protein [Capybara microvirus Cap3_SP_363]|nr:major capsid protein [Capybara microvirus Cap3_SP_363]
MSKGFDKMHIKSAVKDHSKFDLSRKHLTTMNIGEAIPIAHDHLIPGDKVSANFGVFARVAPMVTTPYVDVFFKTATFFVPYHQVMDGVDSWLSGQRQYLAKNLELRWFTKLNLIDLLINYGNSTSVTSATQDTRVDFSYRNQQGTMTYATFTRQGKLVYKILRSLGYQIPRNVNLATSSTWYQNEGQQHLNALPLLCYAKAFNDWMSNSNRFNNSRLSQLLYDVKRDVTNSMGYTAGGHLLINGIKEIIDGVTNLQYEDNYFTTAWEAPNSPLNQLDSVDSVDSPNANVSNSKMYETNTDLFFVPNSISGYGTAITQRAVEFLSAFDKWVRRNNYSGTKEIEKVYSKFGIKIDDYKTRYAYIVNRSSAPMQIGDVTAMANSVYQGEDVALGDYVGKGIVQGGSKFSFTSSDYGMLVTVGYITCKPLYVDGFDREVLKSQPLDWYTPEFDTLQSQAISSEEVDSGRDYNDPGHPGTEVYGFTSRYNEYRFAKDQVTGDLTIIPTYKVWTHARDLSDILKTGNLKAQSTSMVQMSATSDEYNRIFSVVDGYEDKFILAFNYSLNALRPMKSISGALNLGEGSLTMENGGTEID